MFHCMSCIYSFKEAGQDLVLSIADMVEGILEQAKGGSVRVKQSRQTDALSKLMQTGHEILEGVRGKSVIEMYVHVN